MLLNTAPTPKPKPVKAIRVKKRKKKTNRQLLERQADTLVREIVLKRDGYCVCPAPKKGHSPVLQNGHLISRTRKSVRWDLWNCNVNCASCNMIHEYYPERYTKVFLVWYGQEEYGRIVEEAENVQKISVEQLQILCNELTSIKMRQESDKDFKPRFSQADIISGKWRRENEMSKMPERNSPNP